MTYIIAELGSVPDGSVGSAMKLIEHCAKVGADACKLQDHLGERIKGDPPWFKPGHETRAEYLKRTEFTDQMWQCIRACATACEVDLIVSPFSVEAVERLERVPVDAYKVASGQVTNKDMLRAIGMTRRPVYVSSGMTTWDETNDACNLLDMMGCKVTLFHCTSEYPCAPERVGLNLVSQEATRKKLGRSLWQGGLSDHTTGFAASLAAITLGASVIERHVCFDRRQYGSDAMNSLTLDEFKRFVEEVRALDVMLANPVDKDALVASPSMQQMRSAFLERPAT